MVVNWRLDKPLMDVIATAIFIIQSDNKPIWILALFCVALFASFSPLIKNCTSSISHKEQPNK